MTTRTITAASYQKAARIQKAITEAATKHLAPKSIITEFDEPFGKGVIVNGGVMIYRKGAAVTVEADGFDWMPEIG